VTGTAGDQRNAALAGQPRESVGHVHGGGLVAHVDQPEACAQRRVEHGHDVVAREREDGAKAGRIERARKHVGAPELGWHEVLVASRERATASATPSA
jgi:hypothetical protein